MEQKQLSALKTSRVVMMQLVLLCVWTVTEASNPFVTPSIGVDHQTWDTSIEQLEDHGWHRKTKRKKPPDKSAYYDYDYERKQFDSSCKIIIHYLRFLLTKNNKVLL